MAEEELLTLSARKEELRSFFGALDEAELRRIREAMKPLDADSITVPPMASR